MLPLRPEMGPIMPDLGPLGPMVGWAASELKMDPGVGLAKPDFFVLLKLSPSKSSGPNPSY